MIKIITDSTSDLSKDLLKKYEIDVLPLYVHMGEQEYKDGVDVTVEEIYAWSDANKTTPKTAAFSIEDAVEVMTPYQKQGADLIMFAISEDMSASANVMRLAAESMDYSDHVYVIDSENLSTGIGLLVLEAARMVQEGRTAADIVTRIEALRSYVRASFVVDTLTYLHRGGRCSATAALVGGVFKIKPRIFVKDGKMDAGKKYRGNLDKVILQYVKDMEPELKKAKRDRVFITHSNAPADVVASVKDYLEGLGRFKEVLVTAAGGVISSHCGPGTLGVLFIAGGTEFGPYDEQFDANHNGVMEEDERAAEAAYIRHLAEENSEDDEDEDNESLE